MKIDKRKNLCRFSFFLISRRACREKSLTRLFFLYRRSNMSRKYKRITLHDRKIVESMLKSGSSVSKVAKTIGTHRDTIYRELKRCGCTVLTEYTATAGQQSLKRLIKEGGANEGDMD